MKKHPKIKAVLLIAVIIVLSLLLFACREPEADKHKVALWLSDTTGVTVDGDNPVYVEDGGTAVFKLNFENGYILTSVEGASFDAETSTVRVENVRRDTSVSVMVEKSSIDTSKKLGFVFNRASSLDTSSVTPGMSIRAGTLITVTAGDTSRAFRGWMVGGRIISTDRTYTFRLTEDMTDKNGVLLMYSRYVDANRIVYEANGGQINSYTVNMSGNEHASVSSEGDTVTVIYSAEYLSYIECGTAFYDDGSFYRDGFVLTEYNTKPDGTGESFSLGSKISLSPIDDKIPTLYCIWSPDTDHSKFETVEVTISRPTAEERAPHWVESGLKIVGYTGNDSRVVIPEEIDGRTVIAIGEGAFSSASFDTIVLNRFIHTVEDGAFVGCASLNTMYFPDGIYSMNNEALDAVSQANLEHIYVNASLAPRHAKSFGAFALKLSRIMASMDQNRVIMIAGSSAYQGLSSEFLEALLKDEYRVINFGTTRTTNIMIYLEAMQHFAHSGDVILYSPENSAYGFGERELYWKTLRDMEGMVNLYRYIDMRGYTNFFGAFSDYNQNYRYTNAPGTYEDILDFKSMNKYGDFLAEDKDDLKRAYDDVYYITLSERIKSRNEGQWDDKNFQEQNKDYTDPNNPTWCSFTDPYLKDSLNRAIECAKRSGAKVYFAFCPVDASKLVSGADTLSHLLAYDELIAATFSFDGVFGTVLDSVYKHGYFYDNAFHLNDKGRTYYTYRIYLNLSELLGFDSVMFTSVGTDFDGCIFEHGSYGWPSDSFSPR